MSETPLVRFRTIDIKTNTQSSVGYALDLYKFKFEVVEETIPDYISNNIFVWQFGDGEYSTELSPIHWYKAPGKYTVTLTLYGIDNDPDSVTYNKFKSYINGFTQTMNIYNFVPGLGFDSYGDMITLLSASTDTLSGSQSDWLKDPLIKFNFNLFNSWQSYENTKGEYTVNLNVSKSLFPLLKASDYKDNLYLYLSPTDKFLDDDFQPINSITVSGTPVYYTRNLTGGMEQPTTSEEKATFVGLSSTGSFYYSGVPADNYAENTTLEIFLDTTNYRDKYEINNNISTNYNTPILITKPFKIDFANYYNGDDITSDIISGILNVNGINEPAFDIYKHKYFEKPINFVFRYGFTSEKYGFQPVTFIDNLTLLSTGDVYLGDTDNEDNKVGTFGLYNENNECIGDIYTNQVQQPYGYYSTKGGYLKGFAYVKQQDTDIKNAYFKIELTKELLTKKDISELSSTTGENISSIVISSSLFDIENENQVQIRKVNEDFKMWDEMQRIMLQPNIRDNVVLNTYLSSIMGEYDNPNSLSIKPFEKIANWVSNVVDIDTCNVENLYNYFYSLNFNISENNYSWPADFRRLIDLFSIPYFRLRGAYNRYDNKFLDRGYVDNIYDSNRGELIDTSSYIITAGAPIIAYEKFSEQYSLINTNVVVDRNVINDLSAQLISGGNILSSESFSTLSSIYPGINVYLDNTETICFEYPLSSYHDDNETTVGWGWNLILPDHYTNINDYYSFYEYKFTDQYIDKNIIDWDNPFNTITMSSISSLDVWNDIKSQYFMQSMYNSVILSALSADQLSSISKNDVKDLGV